MQIRGIAHRAELRAQGVRDVDLARWQRQGTVRSLQPWYITEEAPQDVVDLLRIGMRPTCLDAAALHGLWVPLHTGTHVYRPRTLELTPELRAVRSAPVRRRRDGSASPSEPQNLVLHGPALRSWPTPEPVADVELVLEHAGRCLPTWKAAVLMESALHRGVLSLTAVERIVASLPHDARRALRRVRADAESGTETTVRWWFESRGVKVRSQVRFPGGDRRMDLLVGNSWVIECDSREFHDDPGSYDEDRERDLYLAMHGYRVTRLSWEQVFLRWESTEAKLLSILRSGDHRRPPRAGGGQLAA